MPHTNGIRCLLIVAQYLSKERHINANGPVNKPAKNPHTIAKNTAQRVPDRDGVAVGFS